MTTMNIDTDGKIAIPPDVQEQLGFQPGMELQFEVMGDILQIRKPKSPNRGTQMIAAISGKATSRLTTNDIMQLTRDVNRYRTYFPSVQLITP